VNAFAFAVVQLVQLVQGYQPMLQQLGVLLEIIEPVWLCGCGCVFFKTQLQPFGYRKKQFIVHWVSPIFCVGNAVFAKQELHVFLHCSRNCTVQ
jgi:hypothetical protein